MPIDQIQPRSYAGIGESSGSFDAGLRAHMQRVYNYMAGGVGLTGVLAWLAANTPLANIVFAPGLSLVFALSPLAFILALNFGVQRMKSGTVQTLFWLFCASMGLSMAYIFLIYTNASIARAFFITSATFAGMSLWGYTTKRDLSAFGSFLMMGLMGLVIASLFNLGIMLFTGQASSMLHWMISVIGVLIFTGLTAWETQQIKQTYAQSWGSEANSKLAVMSALSLYLNFVNAFQFMLRLIGDRR
ncbi:MAG: Bax inhibitor-1/YccA family protein [Alphaproteobacteria bacterium]